MPLKKDPSGRRAVEIEIELPGTPEQVWQAFATGPGYSAWFVPAEIEEREGGALVFHLGTGMSSPGRVTAWQPPVRFAYEEAGWSGDAPPLATEIVIEARDGGTCRVRMVHGLFTARDDWDDELAGMEQGWGGFLDILRLYLGHFAGAPAASARPTVPFAGSLDDGWPALRSALGLTDARVGERRAAPDDGAPRLAGTVEDVREHPRDRAVTLRLEQPMSGVALVGAYEWQGNVNLAVSLYLYGDAAAATVAAEEPRWSAWLAERFAPGSAADTATPA